MKLYQYAVSKGVSKDFYYVMKRISPEYYEWAMSHDEDKVESAKMADKIMLDTRIEFFDMLTDLISTKSLNALAVKLHDVGLYHSVASAYTVLNKKQFDSALTYLAYTKEKNILDVYKTWDNPKTIDGQCTILGLSDDEREYIHKMIDPDIFMYETPLAVSKEIKEFIEYYREKKEGK